MICSNSKHNVVLYLCIVIFTGKFYWGIYWGSDDVRNIFTGCMAARWCATRWVACAREVVPPIRFVQWLLENGKSLDQWTSPQKRIKVKL